MLSDQEVLEGFSLYLGLFLIFQLLLRYYVLLYYVNFTSQGEVVNWTLMI